MTAITASPEAFAPANGMTLCYDSFGDPAATPLLLIMGLGAQMVVWDDDFCADLAGRGLYVIRFDNRDIGRSTWLDKSAAVNLMDLVMKQMRGEAIAPPYLLRDMAADAVGLLDHLGIKAAHIAGASMGGMIAQEMAVHFASRVLSLTSIMSSTGNPALPGPTPEATTVLMRAPALDRQGYIDSFCASWKVLRAGDFPDEEALDPARAARMFARGLNPAGVARQMLAIFASGNREAGLATVRAPTLVIHGVPDPLVRIEAGRATAAAIPGAQMMEVAGMGHAMPREIWPQVIGGIAGMCGV